MHKQILGMETEYSTSMVAANGSDYSLRTGLRSFLNHLHRELEHVLDLDSRGAYLINGARFYIDYGQHPEYAAPEGGDPTELVSQVFAGDKLMLTVADRMRARSKVVEGITFLTSNVEHSGSHTTCGCHESYSHRGEPSRLAPVMTAFLVSRLIWSGAGERVIDSRRPLPPFAARRAHPRGDLGRLDAAPSDLPHQERAARSKRLPPSAPDLRGEPVLAARQLAPRRRDRHGDRARRNRAASRPDGRPSKTGRKRTRGPAVGAR